MRECQPAKVEDGRAYRVGESVVVGVDVLLPTPGFDVEILQSPLDVVPPRFDVVRCARPGAWPRVVERRQEAGVFRIGSSHEEIVLTGEDQSELRVPVQDLFEAEPEAARTAGFLALGAEEAGGAEAIGMSRNLSFDEAFADALSKLPGEMSTFPDQLTTVAVTGISGWFGGIAGFHHLVVRVRR